jgi:hypothetical protein
MHKILENKKLKSFHQEVFRIFTSKDPRTDEFDDLTSDLDTRNYAHQVADSTKLNSTALDKLYQDAIEFPFINENRIPSRFSDASFPVWYESTELKTSFYETAINWKITYLDSPHFPNKSYPPGVFRAVTVNCNTMLIDLRSPKFTGTDNATYAETRQIGLELYQEGFSGLLYLSARARKGENIAIFKKKALSSPAHHDYYIYEYNPQTNNILIKQLHSGEVIFTI